jgi:class 3 adenylate cyclase
MAWLEFGPERIEIRGTCSVGRSASNQLSIPDEKVSRRHAIVHSQENSEFWLVDLGSRNGTTLNERRVTQPVQLRDGDEIHISGFRLIFHQHSFPTLSSDPTLGGGETLREIRQTTCWMLVADIEGSTLLSKRFAADEAAALTGRWLAECKQVVEECGGAINKFLGDGFFAYWRDRDLASARVAHAIEALRRLQIGGDPQFRIVVHYGSVFTGAGASLGEESLSGPEVNLVFRMEKLAGALGEQRLASDPARNQLLVRLAFTDLGTHRVPGFDEPFAFHRF